MKRTFATALIAAVALGTAALAVEPAAAMPVAGAAVGTAEPLPAQVEQVRWHRGYHRGFFHRGYGWHRGYGYRRHYGWRRGLPGHPIRRILRAL